MAGSVYAKNIKRTIFGSFGRYIAILAIIALGVGFFAGVKNSKASMMETCDKYVEDFALYDFRLISTYGFTDDDVKAMEKVAEVEAAEGVVYADFFSEDSEENSIIIRAHSVSEDVNKINLVSGRMPEKANECIADDANFTEDDIGRTLKLTDENEQSNIDAFKYDKYKIVGIAKSPYYMLKSERGTTSLGDGKVSAFVYMPLDGFTSEYFTEIFVTCKEQGFIFSDEYEKNMEAAKEPVKAAAEKQATLRYEDIVGEAQDKIDDGKKELQDGRDTLSAEKADTASKLKSSKNTLDAKKKEISAGKAALSTEKKNLTAKRTEASAGLAYAKEELAKAEATGEQAQIEAWASQVEQAESGIAQIDAGLAAIASKEKELSAGEKKIESGYKEYYAGKSKAEREFSKAEAELEDAEKEIAKAEAELNDLEVAEVFMQEREDNLGFGSFESNADIVDSVAKVFPIFFFLIAALVCSTTMSRMIDEERTQIGAFRALGYTNGRIMLKYMIYSGSAAVVGCIAGFLAGSKYFPIAIWIAYGMMFGFAPLEFYFSWELAIISLVVSLVCSMGTTYFACRGQLANMPAEILRPKAPKAGKRIILERITPLWSRMKFLHKVTARNILRYKKRMIMMILGIGGCAALVLAGFGMHDSVAGVSDHQYKTIQKYDVMVAFTDKLDDNESEAFDEEYGKDISNSALFQQTTVTFRSNDAAKTGNLIITDDENMAKEFVLEYEGEKIPAPGDGEAVINNKMAEMLGLDMGDKIEIEYDDTHRATLTVSGIYRNYVNSYIFINGVTYEDGSGKNYEPSMMYISLKNGRDAHEMADDISSFPDIMAISLNEDVRASIDEMMLSLNYIILLVLLCAGALAFIVLFNLSNINMTERVREIATIEVLGFYPSETGAYVFRENLILAILGIIAGIPMGLALHKFIMNQISVDMVSFNEVVDPSSYVYAVIMVLFFTFIVDRIMRVKLRKINMAEALKSIE